MADMEDEFEFKPLTDGLGFHKKVVQLKNEVEDSGLIKSQVATSVPSVPVIAREAKQAMDAFLDPQPLKPRSQPTKAATVETVNRLISTIPNLDFENSISKPESPKSSPILHEPLPRKQDRPRKEISMSPLPADPSTIFNPLDLGMESETSALPAEPAKPVERISVPPKRTYKEIPFQPVAAFFDGLVIAGLTCIFAVVLLMITGVDLSQVLANLSTDLPTQLGLGILVFAVIELYVIVSRSFFGSTLGEWAFDVHLGEVSQQDSIWFPLKVTWRSIVIAATGFLLLPLLSMIFRRDLTGTLCGLKLRQLS